MAKQHELTIDIDGEQWDRIGIKTHLITILEPLDPIIEEQVKPQFQPGDFITISEKVVVCMPVSCASLMSATRAPAPGTIGW